MLGYFDRLSRNLCVRSMRSGFVRFVYRFGGLALHGRVADALLRLLKMELEKRLLLVMAHVFCFESFCFLLSCSGFGLYMFTPCDIV